MSAMKKALQEGKINHIGASSHNMEMAKLIIESGEVETMMFPFNCLSQECEELSSLAMEHDVGFLAMKPFAGGVLTETQVILGFLMGFENIVPIPCMETITRAIQCY
jgi:uncharacterized protein